MGEYIHAERLLLARQKGLSELLISSTSGFYGVDALCSCVWENFLLARLVVE
jgi:hypothetical protein